MQHNEKQGTKEPINTFIEIKEIEYIYHQKVKIVEPRKRTVVVQCARYAFI